VAQGRFLGNVFAPFADQHSQFYFMLAIVTERRNHRRFTLADNAAGRFEKKHRLGRGFIA
jgi:hypothetical protein